MAELKIMKIPQPTDIKVCARGDNAIVKTVNGDEYGVGDRLERAAHYGFIFGINRRTREEGWVVHPQVIAALAKGLIEGKGDRNPKVPTFEEAVAYIREKGIQAYPYEAKEIKFKDKGEIEILEEYTPRELAEFRNQGLN